MQAAFVHHTVTAVDYAPEESAGIVLGIARYHRDSNGWNDIGYNFLVDRYGVVFEGRAGGIEAAVIGAQAQGWNSVSTGIACLGTFTNIPLDAPAMEALAKLIGWKLSLHGVPVQGQVTLDLRRRREQPLPGRHARRLRAHQRPPRRLRDLLPGRAALRAAAGPAGPRRPLRHPVSAITVKAASQKGAKPTNVSGVLRFADGSSPAGATLGVEYMAAGSAWTQVTTTACGGDGSWATSVQLPASRPGPRRVRRRRHPPAAGIGAGRGQGRPEHVADQRQAARQGRHARSRSAARWPRASRACSACWSARSATAG